MHACIHNYIYLLVVIVIDSCTDMLPVPAVRNIDKDPQLILTLTLFLREMTEGTQGNLALTIAKSEEKAGHRFNPKFLTHFLDNTL